MKKLLFDYIPLILFFLVYKVAGMHPEASYALAQSFLGPLVAGTGLLPDQGPIMLATVVVIVATVCQILYLKLRGQKVDAMLWVTASIIVIMGSLTIYLHDENFIKWKPTILYWVMALMLAFTQFVLNKNMMRQVMEQQIKLPEPIWARLGLAWIVFFTVIGAINLVVAYVIYAGNLDAWVNFKVYGITALFFVFIIGQSFMLGKYMEEEAA
ncbi:septation protein A [Massilia sp. S19_KUP03_FR1]|uniref:septation protein A n=1 Tax=Massilia sp. S19_KUP03_FR1 TaxID=3025503 RepID=UPI002FCD8C75